MRGMGLGMDRDHPSEKLTAKAMRHVGGQEERNTYHERIRQTEPHPYPPIPMNQLTTSESPTSTRPSVRSTEAESESFGAESLDHTETTVPSSQNSPRTSQQRLLVHRAESYVFLSLVPLSALTDDTDALPLQHLNSTSHTSWILYIHPI